MADPPVSRILDRSGKLGIEKFVSRRIVEQVKVVGLPPPRRCSLGGSRCSQVPATTRCTPGRSSCVGKPRRQRSALRLRRHRGGDVVRTPSRRNGGRTDTTIRRCTMSDQSTTRAAAYGDIHRAGDEPVGGKQACRRTFLKASGGLIAGAAAQVSSAAAVAQGAVAADNGPRDIMK